MWDAVQQMIASSSGCTGGKVPLLRLRWRQRVGPADARDVAGAEHAQAEVGLLRLVDERRPIAADGEEHVAPDRVGRAHVAGGQPAPRAVGRLLAAATRRSAGRRRTAWRPRRYEDRRSRPASARPSAATAGPRRRRPRRSSRSRELGSARALDDVAQRPLAALESRLRGSGCEPTPPCRRSSRRRRPGSRRRRSGPPAWGAAERARRTGCESSRRASPGVRVRPARPAKPSEHVETRLAAGGGRGSRLGGS